MAKQGKSEKYGRNKKRPSSANQALRTAKNKRLRAEREAKRQATPKAMKKARGTARKLRRFGMPRSVKAVNQAAA